MAAFEQSGVPLDLGRPRRPPSRWPARRTTWSTTASQPLEHTGLLNTPGTRSVKLKPWNEVGDAVEDVINAVTELDNAGFHGPYALALTPKSYNHLFRGTPRAT